jgi:hypothetical protein
MMSMPMLRATSAWLEWARRVGMTTSRDVIGFHPLILVSKHLLAVHWRREPQHFHEKQEMTSHIILLFGSKSRAR